MLIGTVKLIKGNVDITNTPAPSSLAVIGNIASLPADVLWGSFVMRDKRTPKDVCGEARILQHNVIFFAILIGTLN